ncbi:MAG TPA: TonB-dependent receptor [Arachidicoccus sp.]
MSLLALRVSAQDTTKHEFIRRINGVILDTANAMPLGAASIKSFDENKGVVSKSDGSFSLSLPEKTTKLIVAFVGYQSDTITLPVDNISLTIYLKSLSQLSDVQVRAVHNSTEISLVGVQKTENIGVRELLRAACCNISESFETTPSVDVGYTDAVSGYKQIEMLGLSATNTSFTRENIPDTRGLASITGLTFTPGTWLESIQLSKGAGSVVNGFEGASGQINTEWIKPFESETPRLILNGYQNIQGRSEGNLVLNHSFKDSVSSNLFLYARSDWRRNDMNNDGFMDNPVGKVLVGANRWFYFSPAGWEFQAGIKGSYLDNTGGQLNYHRDIQEGLWGYQNDIKRAEGWAKIGKVYIDKPYKSMGIQLSGVYHQQNSLYGSRNYDGVQHSFYANYIYQTRLFNDNNVIKGGASFQLDNYNEQFVNAAFNRREIVSGMFTEYSYSYGTKFNIVAGLRVDYHNMFGTFATPRIALRYALFDRTTIRISAGRAQHTTNFLSENTGLMASSRVFEINGKPIADYNGTAYPFKPEAAWNTGVNITQKFRLNYNDGTFSVDYYYTDFRNQVVADFETPGTVNFYNLAGKSYAHSLQAQLDYELIHNFSVRLAYRYYDVKATYDGILKEKPLVANNRSFANLNYATKNNWSFNYTLQWIGTKRLPETFDYSAGRSPSFVQMNAQINKSFKNDVWVVYVGVENITNYMQHPLILGASNAFGNTFDASQVWGSAMGRNMYVGFKWNIARS